MRRRAGSVLLFAGLAHSGRGFEPTPTRFEDSKAARIAVVDPITSAVYVDISLPQTGLLERAGPATVRSYSLPPVRWWARAAAVGAMADVMVMRTIFVGLRGRKQRTSAAGRKAADGKISSQEAPKPVPAPAPKSSEPPPRRRGGTLLSVVAGAATGAGVFCAASAMRRRQQNDGSQPGAPATSAHAVGATPAVNEVPLRRVTGGKAPTFRRVEFDAGHDNEAPAPARQRSSGSMAKRTLQADFDQAGSKDDRAFSSEVTEFFRIATDRSQR
mmetsp:Transcript_20550/g.46895  ORF Transcript_20550/g.46895 Transcript_20550/m.46895 type:complete len:272 (-) Transcript_20550:263-1078(-)